MRCVPKVRGRIESFSGKSKVEEGGRVCCKSSPMRSEGRGRGVVVDAPCLPRGMNAFLETPRLTCHFVSGARTEIGKLNKWLMALCGCR